MKSWYRTAQAEDFDVPIDESSYRAFVTQVSGEVFPHGTCPRCGKTGPIGSACQACKGMNFIDVPKGPDAYHEHIHIEGMAIYLKEFAQRFIQNVAVVPESRIVHTIAFPAFAGTTPFWDGVLALYVNLVYNPSQSGLLVTNVNVLYSELGHEHQVPLEHSADYGELDQDHVVRAAYEKASMVERLMRSMSPQNKRSFAQGLLNVF